jgi:membrane-bound ClpP family serine protease
VVWKLNVGVALATCGVVLMGVETFTWEAAQGLFAVGLVLFCVGVVLVLISRKEARCPRP